MEITFVLVPPARGTYALRPPILVGRSAEARLQIQKDSVSRRHCEFFLAAEQVFVRDLGSTNGTLVNEEEITAQAATVVPPGSVVNVGGVAFQVLYDSPAEDRPAAPAGDDTVPLPDDDAAAADPRPPAASPAADDENLDDFFKSMS